MILRLRGPLDGDKQQGSGIVGYNVQMAVVEVCQGNLLVGRGFHLFPHSLKRYDLLLERAFLTSAPESQFDWQLAAV
jgi:hypothetical protein